jgi:hypothetical protein
MAAVLLQSPEESLRPDDGIGEGLDQAADQRQREADLGHRRDVIQVDLQLIVIDAVDHLREEAVQPLLARRLVVVGRQHQGAAAAELDGMLGQHDGVRQRRRARARHQPGRVDVAVDQLLQELHALVEPQRVALAGRAERRQARTALGHQPLAVSDEPLGIGSAVLTEGGEHRGDDA